MNNSISQKLIYKLVQYYSNGFWSMSPEGLNESDKKSIARCIIFARKHYIERTITLPISLKKDIKTAIEFEIENLQQEFHVFYKIYRVEEGKSHIMLWQIPRNIVPKGTLLALPETFLFSGILSVGQVVEYEQLNGKRVLLAKGINSIHSSGGSSVPSAVFSQMIGVISEKELKWPASSLTINLSQGLLLGWKSLVNGFWVKTQRNSIDWKALIRPYVIPVSVCFSLYLILSSSLVALQHSRAEELVNSQRQAINDALELQRSIDDKLAQFEVIEAGEANDFPLWRVWQVLAPLYQQNVMFKFIRSSDNQIFFGGTASSAADVLEMLLNDPVVDAPQFTSSVKKEAGRERFIIRFGFRASTSLAQEPKNAE